MKPGADIAIVTLKKVAGLIALGAAPGRHAFLFLKRGPFNRYNATTPVVIEFLRFWNRYKPFGRSGLKIAKAPVVIGL